MAQACLDRRHPVRHPRIHLGNPRHPSHSPASLNHCLIRNHRLRVSKDLANLQVRQHRRQMGSLPAPDSRRVVLLGSQNFQSSSLDRPVPPPKLRRQVCSLPQHLQLRAVTKLFSVSVHRRRPRQPRAPRLPLLHSRLAVHPTRLHPLQPLMRKARRSRRASRPYLVVKHKLLPQQLSPMRRHQTHLPDFLVARAPKYSQLRRTLRYSAWANKTKHLHRRPKDQKWPHPNPFSPSVLPADLNLSPPPMNRNRVPPTLYFLSVASANLLFSQMTALRHSLMLRIPCSARPPLDLLGNLQVLRSPRFLQKPLQLRP